MSSDLDFSTVNVMLVDPSLNSRTTTANLLRDNGFQSIRYGKSLNDAIDAMNNNPPDLMIMEADLPVAGFCDMIYQLRHHEIGTNPFLPLIALVWTAEPEAVRMIIDAGADDLLVRPLSAAQLLVRIKTLTVKRKPFVVTSDYIGPDRRKDTRDSKIPQVVVPNTLKGKAYGEPTPVSVIQQAINESINTINIQKLERYAVQIDYLVRGLVPNLEKGKDDTVTQRMLERLLYVGEDTARRLTDTKYYHVSELCQSLIKVTRDLLASENRSQSKELKLLTPLSDAIRGGFDTTKDTQSAAREISRTVS